MEKWYGIIKNTIIVLILVAIAIVFIHQTRQQIIYRIDSPNKIVMNTVAKITAVTYGKEKAQKSIDAAFEKIFEIDRLANRYDPNSQLSKVNRLAGREKVKVDKELFDILQKSINYYRASDGAFDVTVGPLVDLWRTCAEANSIPSDKQITDAKKLVGSDKLLLDSNDFSVRFAVEGMSLDLGGIAKGFAVDLAKDQMLKAGASGGFIAIGGEIGCFGNTEDNENWTVGIQNPFAADNGENPILKLALSNVNISTSGNYRRFETIGGKHFSHILDPKTGTSAEELVSVTIITSDGSQADAYATAISVMGVDKGLKLLIEKTKETEAILIKPNREVYISKGAAQYLVK